MEPCCLSSQRDGPGLLWYLVVGVPGETAYYGILFPWTSLLAISLAILTVPNLLIPVFHKVIAAYHLSLLQYENFALKRETV